MRRRCVELYIDPVPHVDMLRALLTGTSGRKCTKCRRLSQSFSTIPDILTTQHLKVSRTCHWPLVGEPISIGNLLMNKKDSIYAGEVIAGWAMRYLTIPEESTPKSKHRAILF